ncbi:hypothetical protein EVAR_9540_1 [Eumeta japonica]|uniref:Uncharacterized protein n=1 Tax=Eumeta variegata TaxID=151549 RepID=A0A4C1U3U8_EUMVA|nr:hypothetical protein EVAR_9540_1 [Eumeta japonica]
MCTLLLLLQNCARRSGEIDSINNLTSTRRTTAADLTSRPMNNVQANMASVWCSNAERKSCVGPLYPKGSNGTIGSRWNPY